MIWNPGHLPHKWTMERLTGKHSSSPFNPDIAHAFFRAAYLEAWGRGIGLIRNACEEQGFPPPAFSWDNGLWVEFPFPKEAEKMQLETVGKTSVKTSVKIAQIIRKNAHVTIPELAEITGVATRSVERNIKKLQNTGALRRVGPDKGGYWEVVDKV